MSARSVLVLVGLGVLCFAMAWALSWGLGPTRPPERDTVVEASADAGADSGGFWAIEPARIGPDGSIVAAPTSETYACLQPALPVVEEAACARGEPYPACRWRLPDEPDANGLYTIWRNTTPEHRWARPGLVSLVLAAAREYAMRWPGEHVTIGDLDAPGPRHQTHDRGVDVDLYLEHAMADRNEPGRGQVDNYYGLSRRAVALHRARVMDLGKILATCSRGRLRIYYADREVVDAFRAWFDAQGLVTDVAAQAMQMHNALHRFHYHMTVAEDLATLPRE